MNFDDKTLKSLIARRHPMYKRKLSHWKFLAACYAGERSWFDDNVFKYVKEGDEEFEDRIKRAYRFNHSREIVDLVSKYLFKAVVERNEEDASLAVKEFWKQSTLNGMDIQRYSRQLSDKSSIYGRIWVVVDNNKQGKARTIAEEKKQGGRTYSYIVKPENVLDASFDEYGLLNWILVHEIFRDDKDPTTSSGAQISRFRLWTRDNWYLFELRGTQNNPKVVKIDENEHGLGEVPVFPVDHISTDDSPWFAPSLINDIAYLDRAVANYLSNMDAIIQDQTFSQLAMPAQGLAPGDDAYTKMLEMGTKRIFLFDGQDGAKPFYLSPDVKQAELLITIIKQIINEIYHTVGMAGERTKQDNSVGIDNSSGVAKAYDFERVHSLLTSKASSLEKAEENIIRLVNLWEGQSNKESDEDLIKYPENFDVRGLSEEFEIAAQLSLIESPMSVRKHQMQQLVDKLFPRLPAELKKQIKADIKQWEASELQVPSLGLSKGKDKDDPNPDGDKDQDAA